MKKALFGKYLILSFVLCSSAFGQRISCSSDGEGNILEGQVCKMLDSRDKKLYKVVKINGQVWMAQNLNYITGECFNRESAYCEEYGRLYDWSSARKACPEGWHLPTKPEWDKLIDAIDNKLAGKRLRARIWGGADDYEFAALPGGYRLHSGFLYNGTIGNWWTATDKGSDCKSGQAFFKQMHSDFDEVLEYCYDKGLYGFSVRCLKDED
ncbi:MAG: hypothetical protein LBQ87_03250 [Candidatus Fibromonas sp.]|jgi:uncharacterized protein (TIGR02145 family)|nr:hypothetical protein [Candidatus Fibromonas sp.]